MAALFIILLVVLLLLSYLFFAPFFLEANSIEGFIRLRFHRIFIAKLLLADNSLFLHFNVAGFKWKTDLLAHRSRAKKPVPMEKPSEQSKLPPLGKMKAIAGSFKINKFFLSLSFGDMSINGILYPWLRMLGKATKKNISINFWNENELILEIENNMFRIARAYLKH